MEIKTIKYNNSSQKKTEKAQKTITDLSVFYEST